MRSQAGGLSSHPVSTAGLKNFIVGLTLEGANSPQCCCENISSSHSSPLGRSSSASSGTVGMAYLMLWWKRLRTLDRHLLFFILFVWDLCPFHTFRFLQRVTPHTEVRNAWVTSTERRKWLHGRQPDSCWHTQAPILFSRSPHSSLCSLLQSSHLGFFLGAKPWCSHFSLCKWKFAEDKDVMILVLPGGGGGLAESIYFVIPSKIPFACSQIHKA